MAQRLRVYRDAHGWDIDDLAQRCIEAGVALTAAEIAELESGQGAGVTLQQLLTLAYVLSVPPVLLFVPVGEDYHFEVTPGVLVAPDAAVRWVSGQAMLPSDRSAAIWQRFARPVHLYRQLDDAHEHRWNAEVELRRSRPGTDREAATDRYTAALANVALMLAAMVEDGMTVPPVPDYTARDMVTLGLALPPGVPITVTEQSQLV